jgi:anti-sigma factor RsiW
MMDCHELTTELLVDYVSGEMPREHRERFEQHLAGCEDCLIYLETYRQTILLTRKLPREPLPSACEQRLRAFVAEMLKEEVKGQGSGKGVRGQGPGFREDQFPRSPGPWPLSP